MIEVAILLLGMLLGTALGAGLALAIAHRRGMFNPVLKPEVKVSISLRPEGDVAASMSAVQPNEYTVVVHPQILVSWDVLYKAAAGAGQVVIPKEFMPPQH